ncbi:hypothetical protein QR685DRAFT_570994 [Neurospora intermedia]|uniref:Uncharacterized protein n=1 Tax=Neurospora intermedia TaxID=5142 RepID=A0ABR3DIH7_NEUIN
MRRRHPLVAWTIGKLRSMRAGTTWLRACRFGSSFHLGSVRVLSFLVPGTTILPSICDDGAGGSCFSCVTILMPNPQALGWDEFRICLKW